MTKKNILIRNVLMMKSLIKENRMSKKLFSKFLIGNVLQTHSSIFSVKR